MEQDMLVIKRDDTLQAVSFDKILNRIKNIGVLDPKKSKLNGVNYTLLGMKVIDQLHDRIKTTKIDELTAEQCATMAATHPDYLTLAGRIIVSNHQKLTSSNFKHVIELLYKYTDANGMSTPLISKEVYNFVSEYGEELNAMIHYERDFEIDYFGFKTLERAYLMKGASGHILERPQHMWMRVALGIHVPRSTLDYDGEPIRQWLDRIQDTYYLLSMKYFTHATPTLFNAGTPRSQLSSCYLVAMEQDSIEGIFDTLKECAIISKYAGGVGLHVHNIRSTGSFIRGTAGVSNGLVPMLRVFNNTARYIDQGGKRNGSFAIYVEPWHPDIEGFLEMKKNHGDEESKARDLFYALWIPDLFMQRVMANEPWSLFCPDECPGLYETYGDEFTKLYTMYESLGKERKRVQARDIWLKVLDSQMETGTPYLLYKDSANAKSNQKNLGTICSSNLCAEIIEYSDKNETAVCNLASIALNRFVCTNSETGTSFFDYECLSKVVSTVTRNLNRVIDINFYPTPKTKMSNLKHRPIGMGVQGLADTFLMLDIAFNSEKAIEVNRLIFETMYFSALETSMKLSKERYEEMIQAEGFLTNLNETCGAYESFEGSPASKGILQFDMWNVTPTPGRYDWENLKKNICKYGLRNSLLIALMPTASTSQILGNNECFEPITSNIYTRRTLAGEFIVVNKYLMNELVNLGCWNESVKQSIIKNKGSIQHLTLQGVDEHFKNKYRTVWEIPMKQLIDMSVDRAPFVCQSQSLNLWVEDPNYNLLTSMHFYAWKKGLKTGIYYLRRKAKHQAQQFTVAVNSKSDSTPDHTDSSNQSQMKDGAEQEVIECELCSS